MKNKQNLHTHSTFCDGKNTPEDTVKKAIERGFDSIGFSIHSRVRTSPQPTPFENFEPFKAEIARLKEQYRGQIDVFCGVEHDFYSLTSPDGYEYSLAAVHYLDVCGDLRGFDRSCETVLAYINDYFDGNAMRFAKCYYQTLSRVPEIHNFDIIAHFDILTKNNEISRFIDVDCKEYKDMAFEAVHSLRGKIPFFEVNTGAMARGYRSSPYPQMDIMKELLYCGFGAMISSDCHDNDYLDTSFDIAREALIEAGFKSRYILTDNGFCEIEI